MQYMIDIDKLRTELADLRRQVQEMEQMIDLAERFGHRLEPNAADDLPPTVVQAPLRGLGTKEAVEWVLRETRKPWKLETLAPEMQRLGWVTQSTDPVSVVRTAVQRLVHETGTIERVGHGLYQWKL